MIISHRTSRSAIIAALVAGLGLPLALAAPASAQQSIAADRSYVSPMPYFKDLKPWDPAYKAPRTGDGHADLQGVWSSASLTTMTRTDRGAKFPVDTLVIPDNRIAELTSRAAYTKVRTENQKASDPNAGVFTDGNTQAGYNTFWIDPGSEYAKINGEWRSSWITSPANGQPPFTAAGRAMRGERLAKLRRSNNTGYELRPLGERCLASFGSQAGPPLNNAMYNNNYQIVQTADAVMIDVEMNHDVRIIRLAGKGEAAAPRPDAVKQWFGDSVGHWEGDTLVVETRNVAPLQNQLGAFPLSERGKVTERFSRVSDKEIFYQFKVEDPVFYTQTWTGEIVLRASKEPIYEYACHEGNYALPGILRGDMVGRDTAIRQDSE